MFSGLIDCTGELCLEAAITQVCGFTSVTNWISDLVHARVRVCQCAFEYIHSFSGDTSGKESACKREVDSNPGSGRSPGGGHGNPLQNSCLENPMDGETWQTTVHRVARVRQD